MRLTRAELTRLLGHHKRLNLRPLPAFDRRADTPRGVDPTMAPSRGMSPAISGTGPKRYVHESSRGIAYAIWSDARERVPVQWVTVAQWRTLDL